MPAGVAKSDCVDIFAAFDVVSSAELMDGAVAFCGPMQVNCGVVRTDVWFNKFRGWLGVPKVPETGCGGSGIVEVVLTFFTR